MIENNKQIDIEEDKNDVTSTQIVRQRRDNQNR